MSPVATVSERRDDVVHGKVCEVSLPKQRLDDLLRLSKDFSPVEAWSKARFRLVLVFCLLQSHVSNPLNEFLPDLAIDLWNIMIKLGMLLRHESLLRDQCIFCILSFNTYCNVCMLPYVVAFATRSRREGVYSCV